MSEIRTGCNDNCPYYMSNTGCFKPEGLFCPPMSTTYEVIYDSYHGIISKESDVSAYAKRCIICGEIIPYNDKCEDIVCDDCKEAVAWVKKHMKRD